MMILSLLRKTVFCGGCAAVDMAFDLAVPFDCWPDDVGGDVVTTSGEKRTRRVSLPGDVVVDDSGSVEAAELVGDEVDVVSLSYDDLGSLANRQTYRLRMNFACACNASSSVR